jgi:hypothetical protein
MMTWIKGVLPEILGALKLLGLVAYAMLEAWLGRTKKVESNSLLELIWRVFLKLTGRVNDGKDEHERAEGCRRCGD